MAKKKKSMQMTDLEIADSVIALGIGSRSVSSFAFSPSGAYVAPRFFIRDPRVAIAVLDYCIQGTMYVDRCIHVRARGYQVEIGDGYEEEVIGAVERGNDLSRTIVEACILAVRAESTNHDGQKDA